MSDRPDLIVSEMGGVAFSSVDQCFRFCDLKRMFDHDVHLSLEWNVPFFVCIDPCAGGEHIDFAVVSFVYVHVAYQVRAPVLYYIYVHAVSLRRAGGGNMSGERDQRLQTVEGLGNRVRVLARKDRLEEAFVHDRREDRDRHVRVQRPPVPEMGC